MEAPLLYTAENHLDEGGLSAFREWYAWRHAPDVWRLGFLSCASYHCVEGDMNVFGIYEIPSSDLFMTPAYQAIPVKDQYRINVTGGITRRAHTLYDQSALPLKGSERDLDRLNADWISVIRFDSTDSSIPEWFAEQRLPNVRMRIAQRSRKERPNSISDRPRFMIVAEWASEPPRGSSAWAAFNNRFGHALSAVSYFSGRRIYPWPDRKS